MKKEESTSTRPYLIRALHEWCTDNGFTPHVAVKVDESVKVPKEYISNGEIVLNVGLDATSGLELGNDFIEFKARFGGKPQDILVPIGRVIAIYARENGQGMAFPAPVDILVNTLKAGPSAVGSEVARDEIFKPVVQLVPENEFESVEKGQVPTKSPPRDGKTKGRPSLTRIK